MTEDRIAFIGAGNMASSLIGGLLATGRAADSVSASDPDATQRGRVAELGVLVTDNNIEAIRDASVIVLAVKPQILEDVVTGFAANLAPGQLLLSIAAGVSSESIVHWAGSGVSVVRCMPNTPALFGVGMAALFANASVTADQRDEALAIASAVGDAIWVDSEAQLDAVTAVSGSGPAYFFYLMEAMIAAGIDLGLDPSAARRLTIQTALGAAEMAARSEQPPAELRRGVTSPGGTTEAALNVFESLNLAATIRQALASAARRSEELAVEFGSA